MEVLHTVLLGACKYMIKSFMKNCSTEEKKEILARMAAFPYSGFSVKVHINLAFDTTTCLVFLLRFTETSATTTNHLLVEILRPGCRWQFSSLSLI